MPLALVAGVGPEFLTAIDDAAPYVREGDIVVVGARAPLQVRGSGAEKRVEGSEIRVHDLDEVRRVGPGRLAAEVLARMAERAVDGVWLHLDADVLDAAVMPAVDSPEPGGMTTSELVALLRPLVSSPLVRGLEVTIYDPDRDPDGSAGRALVESFGHNMGVSDPVAPIPLAPLAPSARPTTRHSTATSTGGPAVPGGTFPAWRGRTGVHNPLEPCTAGRPVMHLTAPPLRLLATLVLCIVVPASAVVRAQGQQQAPPPDESQLRALAAQQPTNPSIYLSLAQLYIQQGRLDDAVQMITNALALTRQQAGLRPAPAPAPAQTFETGDPLRIGGDIASPRKIEHVDPVYPAEAQAANVQGVVIIEALIDPRGNVASTKVLRSVPMLDAAAMDAVNQWRFTPTLLNGEPKSVIMTVTVNFTQR